MSADDVKRMNTARKNNAEARRQVRAIPQGTRVALKPHTDWWMRGARYGTTRGSYSTWARIELDATEGVIALLNIDDFEEIEP